MVVEILSGLSDDDFSFIICTRVISIPLQSYGQFKHISASWISSNTCIVAIPSIKFLVWLFYFLSVP